MKPLKLALVSPPIAPTRATTAQRGDRASLAWTALTRVEVVIALLVLAGGCYLRLVHWAAWKGSGFDESLYSQYLQQLKAVGLTRYPDIVDAYKEYQKTLTGSILPPTRFLYIFAGYLWHGASGLDPLQSLYAVSRAFSIMTLGIAGFFARRLFAERRLALGAFALMAFSPLQIHMAQHALADGFFEFWALATLWALWESMQRPGNHLWQGAYTLGLTAMVLTKENSFFVWIAIVGLLIANRWLRFGVTTRTLVVLTFTGPLAGVAVLANLAGGIHELIDVYRIGVPKNLELPYAIATGDGPWYRYLLDLMIMSPVVLLLATAMGLQLRLNPDGTRDDRPLYFGLLFIVISYFLMCNVKYGMNLRYATIWDFALRTLAVTQVGLLAARLPGRRRAAGFVFAIAALCAFDVYQYYKLAVCFPLYELAPADLLHALKILK